MSVCIVWVQIWHQLHVYGINYRMEINFFVIILLLPIHIFFHINSLKVSGISLKFQLIVHLLYLYTFMLVISRILAWIMILLVNYLSLKMRYYVTNYPTLVYVIVSVCMEKLFSLGFLLFWTVSTGHFKIHSRWVFLWDV